MPCYHIRMSDGTTAIVCADGSKAKKCVECSRESKFLCDWKMPERKSGTCDAPICRDHALEVASDKHLCPWHQKAYELWKRKRAVAPLRESLDKAGEQQALFGKEHA